MRLPEHIVTDLVRTWACIEGQPAGALAPLENELLQGRQGGPLIVVLRLVVAFARYEDEAGVLAPWIADLVSGLPAGLVRDLCGRYIALSAVPAAVAMTR